MSIDVGLLEQCTERLPEADRRAFLRAMLTSLMGSGNLDGLLKMLQSNPIIAKMTGDPEWGPLKIIEDFLKKYDIFFEIDQGMARQLLERFLGYVFTHQENVGINNVFVWLQPNARSQLLNDAVELVASRKWIPVGADPIEIGRFALLCRRSRASLWRRQRRFAEADEELQRLVVDWQSFDSSEMQEISIVEYEIGYSAFLQGKNDEAAKVFNDGARHAAAAKDRVGEIINSFCSYYTQFHGRVLDPYEARRQFLRHSHGLLDQPRQKRVDAWLSTIQNRLFEVSCVLGDVDAAREFAAKLQDDHYLKSLVDDAHQRFAAKKVLACAAVVRREWPSALHHFASFIKADLTQWGTIDSGLLQLIGDDWDELAICYRDAGIAAKEVGKPELARCIWERGLTLPSNSGNTFFQRDICQLLDGPNAKRKGR